MINERSVDAVDAAHFGPGFVRPLYDSYCFSQIPLLIPSLFDEPNVAAHRLLGPLAGRYDHVILLFIDAFGWRFLEQYIDRYPFLRRFREEGIVTKLTSQFPSTTTAHVTDIHSGLSVGESGLYEWFIYEPLVGNVIAPLFFSFAGDPTPNTLTAAGISASDIFPHVTIHRRLSERGIRCAVFQHQSIASSPPTLALTAGAAVHGFATLQEGVKLLSESVLAGSAPAYSFLYYGGIDGAAHHHGLASHQFAGQIKLCFSTLESILNGSLAPRARKTLLLMTADHGQVEGDPEKTVYLNETLPQSPEWLRTPRPSGYSRDMVLHIKADRIAEAEQRIQEHLEGRAQVRRIPDLIDEGFFGKVGPAFLQRIGDLMILPLDQELIWWRGPVAIPEFVGYHGGLSVPEMETELLGLAYG